MLRRFTLEYWSDDGWYVGKLKEVPGVFSQGETLQELEENIQEAYQLRKKCACPRHAEIKDSLCELIRKQLGIETINH